jgi:hypothetical protein
MPAFEILNADFALHLVATLTALALLIHGAASTRHPGSSVFLFYMFGFGVFFVTYALKFEEMSLGFAFGLFAIFSMLRYRTELLGIREMTYLFLVIVVALLGAVSPLAPLELALVLALLVIGVAIMERLLSRNRLCHQVVRYEKIENIKPQRRAELLQDLKERTGLDVRDLRIDTVDLVQDSAMLTIFYVAPAVKL